MMTGAARPPERDPTPAKVPAGVAAGHPATAAAGLAVLEEGGSAADAAVAMVLASCVAETIMTGLAGGGHAIHWDAARGEVVMIDFFVAVPGLAGGQVGTATDELDISFGNAPVHYTIGAGTVGVPGVPAGCDAIWRRWGRLPWAQVIEPALALARHGVPLTAAHALCVVMFAPVMTLHEGAGIYAPRGKLLAEGERLEQPGLVTALELLRDEGSDTFYRGSIAKNLLDLLSERGSVMARGDLEAYAPVFAPPAETGFAGARVLTRQDLMGFLATLDRLQAAPPDRSVAGRALALTRVLTGADMDGHTTNATAIDPDGNACVVTTSLGLGSGDWLPGLDFQLNSMLGEAELLRDPLVPGTRMNSMMVPTLVFDQAGLVLGAGSAGGSRIRSAMVQVLHGVLVEGVSVPEAVERPRIHPVPPVVHAEAGYDEDALSALSAAGYEVVRWSGRQHYFGGVSAAGRGGAAGDVRRSGIGLELRR